MLRFFDVLIIAAAVAGHLVLFVPIAFLRVAQTDSRSAAARRLRDKRGNGDLDGGGGGW